MFEGNRLRTLLGVVMLTAGVLFLLHNLGLLVLGGWVWGVAFMAGGAIFGFVLFRDRANWWAAIPGCVLLAIGALIVFSELPLTRHLAERFGGSLVLGGIGLGFWVVYLLAPGNWWAIIPGGVMFTLAGIAGLGDDAEPASGGVFFLGLAATFALVAILPRPQMRWPWIPAGVLLVMGVGLLLAFAEAFNYIFPVLLILVGAYLALRSLRRSS